MYSANTSSILARLFAKDAIQAALGQASGITAVVRLAAAQIEARVAKSFGWATRIIRAGSSRDSHVRSVRACACVCTVVGEGAPVSYL
mmetsp:Transcript_6805/g.19148  ORF Transcript_6805/g.19148 Transcript_6805/m.19148 type:complete len:88 (+) Transcript_6805:315-578(+)